MCAGIANAEVDDAAHASGGRGTEEATTPLNRLREGRTTVLEAHPICVEEHFTARKCRNKTSFHLLPVMLRKGKRQLVKLRKLVKGIEDAALEPLEPRSRDLLHKALLTLAVHNDPRFQRV